MLRQLPRLCAFLCFASLLPAVAAEPQPNPSAAAPIADTPAASTPAIATPPIATAVTNAAVAPVAQPPAPRALEFDRAEDRAIYFTVPTGIPAEPRVSVDLFDIQHLGMLRPTAGLPYFLFAAKPCRDCLQDSALYLIRPDNKTRLQTFVYPGRILDSKTRALVLESRAFYGRCLSEKSSDVFVVFQKERIDRRRNLQPSVFVAVPGPTGLDEKLYERNFPSLKRTLALVKAKQCREINGRYRVMLRKAIDVRSGNLKDEREDEDEDDEGGNESDTPAENLPVPEGARLVQPAANPR
ncbi:MAG: hypothetical protein NDJ90_08010 [Oligoflexia bacterium]|nr:hypothetical protein [Oligoflexia bacterium]